MTALALAVVSGQAPRPNDLTAYRDVIDSYRGGARAAETDLAWLVDVHAVLEHVVSPTNGSSPIDLTAAAMVHTDVALRLLQSARRPDAATHIDAARTLLRAAVDRAPERAEFARRWRATTAALLHALGAVDLGSSLRSDEMNWLTESAVQSTARARLEEGLAAEIQAAVAGPVSGPMSKTARTLPVETRSALRTAADRFEEALGADPAAQEAALHLGRVRLVERRDVEAQRWLRQAASAPGVTVPYLASMFLGALAERQGRYADAEQEYRAALARFRWGQSAPLALSHLLMRTGRESEARETLAQHFATTRGRVVEPFRTYLADPATDLATSLDQLRAEVWK
jgi:tetratricopeptide (TPR) repeat protein